MNTPTFYETIEGLTKQFPNNMELGASVRKLIWKTKEANQPAPNQLEIEFPE
jgi:hypothetical protein|tara:strand:- start:237 stop:392 length:156 start_codon:yes stop_codon:yes gene_type:complete